MDGETTDRGRRLIRDVRMALQTRADPAKAPAMQAYMKSEMPYYGVQSAGVRAVCKEAFTGHLLESYDEWAGTVLALWRTARRREERYCAISLTGYRAYRDYQLMKALPLYEEMIVTGAWWDFVDEIAANRLGELLARYPRGMRATVRRWSRSKDMWKRRSSIICQLRQKSSTDLDLLYDCIAPSLERREFFLRKAIGWALREYAKTDPDEVRNYVAANEDKLSGLSKREALKNIGR